jgi:hypothetical protein
MDFSLFNLRRPAASHRFVHALLQHSADLLKGSLKIPMRVFKARNLVVSTLITVVLKDMITPQNTREGVLKRNPNLLLFVPEEQSAAYPT